MIPTILIIGFIRTVIIILIIFYGFRLITRYILPLFVQKTIRDMQTKMQEQMREQQRQGKREGEVTIEGSKYQQRNQSKDGEYVDFEEVE